MLKEIGQVAVFIICAQTLLHFRAKESYEKYIKLLISMMVLLILMSPFLEWGGGNEEYSFVEEVKEYEQALGRSLLLSAPEEKAVEEVLQSMVYEAVRQEEAALQKEGESTKEQKGQVKEIQIEEIQIGGRSGAFAENP